MTFHRDAIPEYAGWWPGQYAHVQKKKSLGLCICCCSEPVNGGTRRCAKHREAHNKKEADRAAKRRSAR